jgi:anti-sigma B factor antagonist
VAVRRKQVGPVTVLQLRGNFFGDRETDELQKAIMDEGATGNTRLVLNMTECNRLNSIAIGVLMRGYSNYKGRGGEIKLCGLGKQLKDLFIMTRLIMVFDHHDTEEQAIASFADAEASRTGEKPKEEPKPSV